jgi:hypothetical protein
LPSDRDKLISDIQKIKDLTVEDLMKETNNKLIQSPAWNDLNYLKITSVKEVTNIVSKS